MNERELGGFLRRTDIVDFDHPEVAALAASLRANASSDPALAKACFEWVRDQVQHSSDFRRNPVTCRASEVLRERTGYCYAKSHLLAAVLRANGIPTGFCYQRLSVDGTGPPYSLHGLNAIHLAGDGWYRIDARGNKAGVDAQFTPPVERLAFAATATGEMDLPEIWIDPLPGVLEALNTFCTWDALLEHLPDVTLLGSR